jgi:DNA replication protein DnaC
MNAPDYRNFSRNENEQVLSRLSMYSNMTFSNFDIHTSVTDTEHENLLTAARAAELYAHHPQDEDVPPWVVFMGAFGSGKTHLAAAIANYRREHGEEVLFMTVPDLLDYLRTTFAPDADTTFDKIFNQVRNVPLLVLDDLGTESAKPWAQEKLFQILDYRYVARMETVLTSAKKMHELNERIVSRLLDHRICRNIAINIQSYAKRMKRRT